MVPYIWCPYTHYMLTCISYLAPAGSLSFWELNHESPTSEISTVEVVSSSCGNKAQWGRARQHRQRWSSLDVRKASKEHHHKQSGQAGGTVLRSAAVHTHSQQPPPPTCTCLNSTVVIRGAPSGWVGGAESGRAMRWNASKALLLGFTLQCGRAQARASPNKHVSLHYMHVRTAHASHSGQGPCGAIEGTKVDKQDKQYRCQATTS